MKIWLFKVHQLLNKRFSKTSEHFRKLIICFSFFGHLKKKPSDEMLAVGCARKYHQDVCLIKFSNIHSKINQCFSKKIPMSSNKKPICGRWTFLSISTKSFWIESPNHVFVFFVVIYCWNLYSKEVEKSKNRKRKKKSLYGKK